MSSRCFNVNTELRDFIWFAAGHRYRLQPGKKGSANRKPDLCMEHMCVSAMPLNPSRLADEHLKNTG